MDKPTRSNTPEYWKCRGLCWEQLAQEEIHFDFSSHAPARSSSRRVPQYKGKLTIKETILRWLDEQL